MQPNPIWEFGYFVFIKNKMGVPLLQNDSFASKHPWAFSSTSCISSSVLNLKSIKPFVVVMTFSNPLFFHTLNAIVFTAWYDILKPGNNPTMHLSHFPVVSSRISSGITSLAPIDCLGMPSNENLVLEL